MNKPIFRIALVAAGTLAFALSTNAKLEPSNHMSSQTRWVVNTINARHYLRGTMEQLDGAEMVEAYVASFDYAFYLDVLADGEGDAPARIDHLEGVF